MSNVIDKNDSSSDQKIILPGSRGFVSHQGVLCPHPPRFILCAPDGSMACASVQLVFVLEDIFRARFYFVIVL